MTVISIVIGDHPRLIFVILYLTVMLLWLSVDRFSGCYYSPGDNFYADVSLDIWLSNEFWITPR